MGSKPPDKRQTERIGPVAVPCHVREGARRFRGYLTDLSTRGARVSCAALPPGPGAAVVLELRLGDDLFQTHLPAVVKWVKAPALSSRGDRDQGGAPGSTPGRPERRPPAHSFGLTFAGMSAPDQEKLNAVVEQFRRRAADVSS